MHRLPPDLKHWLERQAERNGSSQNSEIVRTLRDRMESAPQPSDPERSD
jgi:hypothetical protein